MNIQRFKNLFWHLPQSIFLEFLLLFFQAEN